MAPFAWYLLITLIGLAAFPIAYRFFSGLPGRGYAFSKALGLLLSGYVFWLLGSLNVLSNDPGGIIFVFLLLLGAGVWAWRGIPKDELKAWFQENRKMVTMVESLFLVAFFAMVVYRGMAPDLVGTEKPMELAFINAILRSPSMPPHDPWLADYAISYYYFGYVMVAMLAKILGTNGGTAFNLGISMVFAMGAVGAYGIIYNLLAAFQPKFKLSNVFYSLFGPLFIFIVSNVEGFLEYLHGKGLFWKPDANGALTSSFWTWLDIQNLKDPPNLIFTERRFWWWWRASRVIQDYDIRGNEREIIDEFPAFTFYLADLHPHVLVTPFVFLAIALALNVFLANQPEKFYIFGGGKKLLEAKENPESFYNTTLGGWIWDIRYSISILTFEFSWKTFLLGTVVFGGLGFLNLWDFPWYVGLFAGAHLLRRVRIDGWRWTRISEFLVLGLAFGIAGVLAYLPFYLGFSSQAGGILPNLINPSRGAQMWVMFGTLFIPLFFYLVYVNNKKRDNRGLANGLFGSFGFTVFMLAFSLLLAVMIVFGIPSLRPEDPTISSVGNYFLGMHAGLPLREIVQEGLARRGEALGTAVTLVALLGLALGALWPRKKVQGEGTPEELHSSHKVALLLILFGSLLVIIPEFVYLRDLFGNRMNTIFKFYYQAWMMWGLAAAYGSAVLLNRPKREVWLWVYGVVFVAVLTVGLAYPLMGIQTRWNGFKNNPDAVLKLDGSDHFAYLTTEDDFAAVAWLQSAPLGTLVEAVGGSYTHYARISTYTGQPSLLGWPGHEDQWRGSREGWANRETDIRRLYETGAWGEALLIIQQYHVKYIYIGLLERTTYEVNDSKFTRFLTPVFTSGSVIVYEVPDVFLAGELP